MSLADAPKDKVLTVALIDSCEETKRKLNAMGIFLDNKIVKISNSKWGPVLISSVDNSNSKIALGRRIAEKIKVSYE